MTSQSAGERIDELRDARRRLRALIDDLPDAALSVPMTAIVNPPLWEIGHVAWFQELWTLRHSAGSASLREDSDRWYDSAAVHHDTRWHLDLPSREATLAYMDAVLDATCSRLEGDPRDDRDDYFHRLVTYHEDMHGEALVYTRQTLGLPAPKLAARSSAEIAGGGPWVGDVHVPGGTFALGANRSTPFAFDNEKWEHARTVAPFRIARAPVTQNEFAQFVDAGGYERREWWSAAGWQWRSTNGASAPWHWRRDSDGSWLRVHFDSQVELEPHRPIVHVSWFEAEAYCSFAGRRLPTELEWEVAASATIDEKGAFSAVKRPFPWGDAPPNAALAHLDLAFDGACDVGSFADGDSALGCRQMIGNVWEWTSSDFAPYPDFVVDPYKEYSAPWFGDHKVLRGGCFATRSRLIRNTWRNFYTPNRRDVLAGFRTCAR
ncbi:MAG: selenoneine synthase SenA [Planctomycetota bacterium]|nr:selenoneine synthase SenA [Planctomycetota bacterium]